MRTIFLAGLRYACWLPLAGMMGCQSVNNEREFNFDLSRSHNIQDVSWPHDRTGDMFAVDRDSWLTVKLSGDRIFRAKVKQFVVTRQGYSVYSVEAHMHNASLDEVYREALGLMEAWHFDDRKFAKWYDIASQNNGLDDRFETMRNDLEPALALKVLHSFNNDRPWFISFEVVW